MTNAEREVRGESSSADTRDDYFLQVYRQLRQAARNARGANPQQTLNTTALVNEAWLKLELADAPVNDRIHYLKTAALAMRQLLVDYARYRGAEKRDRAMELPLLEDLLPAGDEGAADDVLALDRALEQLEALDARAAELVVLRFFGGATLEEAADLLATSRRSAARDWARARAFLKTQLTS